MANSLKFNRQKNALIEEMMSIGFHIYSPGWFPPENNPARTAPTGPDRPHAFLWLVQREI
ncbi:hypothetical protein PRIPAC_78142 [Pristionchus pacificus]|uniref:Uncharacterized protein n=1 Tax=Pristionchus pacificus TaxID=54126 RepID=A0A2A6BV52_PRIPA|nr:hypothetical protein PRIPAC_78142 [Pristionchus pacificus]|eukprot:PDM69872.1 hypothetical protein PRIPAC_49084 [Pristionchus pacificus]